jgi:hypothetical protein
LVAASVLLDEKYNTEEKRQLRRLRGNVISARREWEGRVREKSFNRLDVRAASDGNPAKTVYFVRLDLPRKEDIFFRKISEEFAQLAKRVDQLTDPKDRKKNVLWLPNILFAPAEVELIVHRSRSVTQVKKEQVRAYLKKHLIEKKLAADGVYYLARPPVLDYWLRIADLANSSKAKQVRLNRAEWSVCFTPGTTKAVPLLPRRTHHIKDLRRRAELANKKLEIVVRHKGVTIYFSNSVETDNW